MYPVCEVVHRRSLNENEEAVSVPTNTALEGRILSEDSHGDDDVKELLKACESEKRTVIKQLRKGVKGISKSCNKLLHEHIDFTCFKL